MIRLFKNKELIDIYIIGLYNVVKNIILTFEMNQHNMCILDLPDEILLIILKKLDNIDVLYSILGIDNRRLDVIAQENIFSDILNFVSISQSTGEFFSISGSVLNRFCIYILPRIHKNVKSLIVESASFESILRATNYPSLTKLEIFNFNQTIMSRYFLGMLFN